MSGFDIRRRVGEQDISGILTLAREIEVADSHKALDDHNWIDLVQGGRKGLIGLTATAVHGTQLIGYAQISRSHDLWGIELLIHPDFRNVHSTLGHELLSAAIDEIRRQGGGHVHCWMAKPNEYCDALASSVGMSRGRDILQLRRPLPLDISNDPPLSVRSFIPGVDESAWLEVNNRAFAWHPEQGDWRLETLLERESQEWFDPSGFLLHEIDGRLAAFCWTKVHSDASGRLGEIYVIATDPEFAGRGIGRRICIAALEHLSNDGVTEAMLYVDADNHRARQMYEDLGFTVDHIDRAFIADVRSHPQ